MQHLKILTRGIHRPLPHSSFRYPVDVRWYSAATEKKSTACFVIALDGPAASGKSSTARKVADRLGFAHVDTGAMYRSITLAVMRANLDPRSPGDIPAVSDIASRCRIRLVPTAKTSMTPSCTRIFLETEDVTDVVRSTPEITSLVSAVAKIPAVRESLVAKQRSFARGSGEEGITPARKTGLVMDGRDIGTTVFPDAPLKVFFTADARVRASRRWKEEQERVSISQDLSKSDVDEAICKIQKEIEERDRQDYQRTVSPLRKAKDAVELDTTNLTIEDQVNRIVDLRDLCTADSCAKLLVIDWVHPAGPRRITKILPARCR